MEPSKPSYLLIAALIALLLGVINYFLFNPYIVLFDVLGIHPANSFKLSHSGLMLFFTGYFSDITWCFALCLVVKYLINLGHLHHRDKCFILLTPFLSEIGQYVSFIPGIFDWFDMLIYALIIVLFNNFFATTLIHFNMNKIKSYFLSAGVVAAFLIMVFACGSSRKTMYRPPNDPCVRHAALNYSPVLVQINIDGSYTMKDLSGAQRSGQIYFMDALSATNYGKYQLAQGVTPNLNIYITINNDGYQHYGARVKFYVYDDNTWFDMPSNYVEPYKLFDDIAAKLNRFVTYGWTHGNCK